jgi:hypothetical protein
VHPFLDLQLVFVELEREVGHDHPFRPPRPGASASVCGP